MLVCLRRSAKGCSNVCCTPSTISCRSRASLKPSSMNWLTVWLDPVSGCTVPTGTLIPQHSCQACLLSQCVLSQSSWASPGNHRETGIRLLNSLMLAWSAFPYVLCLAVPHLFSLAGPHVFSPLSLVFFPSLSHHFSPLLYLHLG